MKQKIIKRKKSVFKITTNEDYLTEEDFTLEKKVGVRQGNQRGESSPQVTKSSEKNSFGVLDL